MRVFSRVIFCLCLIFFGYLAGYILGRDSIRQDIDLSEVNYQLEEIRFMIRQWRYVDALSAVDRGLTTEEIDKILSNGVR